MKDETPAASFVVLLAAAALLGVHAWRYDFLSDDALIIARYARNVVDGHGWVYNPGERVEGYSSFLWTAATALLGLVGIDYVDAVRALSFVGALGILVAVSIGGVRLRIATGGIGAWLAPVLVAASGPVACWALGGLETCGYAALIVGVTLLLGNEDPVPSRLLVAGVTAGLCALTRPEGIAIPLGIVVFRGTAVLRRPRPWLLYFFPPFAALAGGFFLWRRFYYGDWLPNTVYAKVGFGLPALERGVEYARSGMSEQGGLFVWLVSIGAAWFLSPTTLSRLLAFVAMLLLAGVVLVGGDGLSMYRFLVPILPIVALLAARLGHEIVSRMGLPRRAQSAALAAAGLVLAASVASKPQALWQYEDYELQRSTEIPLWTEVGRWLAANAARGSSVACVPIGAIGYYSKLPVHDMLGLTDRHIARRAMPLGAGWAGHEKHDGPYILSRKPTYLLLGNVQILDRPLPTDDPYFCVPPNDAIRAREGDIFTADLLRDYERRVARLPGGGYLHFYQRKPGA